MLSNSISRCKLPLHSKTMKKSIPLLSVLAVLLFPSVTFAHTGAGPAAGFGHGLAHPFGGLDHLLAMVAVGLWAAQMGKKALWAIPLSFVSLMVLGGALGLGGMGLPWVEAGIAASVLILGVLIAAGVRLPLAAGMALAGLFALCHGHAHGAELPSGASAMAYVLGFILATVLLHLSGMGLGATLRNASQPLVVRYAGAALALAGICLLAV